MVNLKESLEKFEGKSERTSIASLISENLHKLVDLVKLNVTGLVVEYKNKKYRVTVSELKSGKVEKIDKCEELIICPDLVNELNNKYGLIVYDILDDIRNKQGKQ